MKKRLANNWYPSQVWITTIAVVAPILMVLNAVLDPNFRSFDKDLSLLFLVIPFGLIFSLPLLGISYVLFILLAKANLTDVVIKLILCLISVAGIIVTFHLIRGTMERPMSIVYSLSVILPSFIFKIYQKPEIVKQMPDNSDKEIVLDEQF